MNGTAPTTYTSNTVGTHTISALYYDDVNNHSSKTNGAVSYVCTGIDAVGVSGTTSTIIHSASINVTIQ